MRILCVVNDPFQIKARQTTWLLIRAATQQHEVFIAGVRDFGTRVVGMGPRVRAVRMTRDDESPPGDEHQADTVPVTLDTCDLILMRTNPARDTEHRGAHDAVLEFCFRAQELGVRVVNDPVGLTRARSKLYLWALPETLRPRSHVSASIRSVHAFLKRVGTCVVKPLTGTRGHGVIRVQRDDEEAVQAMDDMVRAGYVLVQEFIPEAPDGDTRVVVLDGRALEIDGKYAAIRRIPPAGDFRSNIHVGGTPEPGTLTPAMAGAVDQMAPRLARDGIRMAGLDFLGGKLIEVNVYSPGGLFDAERFFGVAFAEHVVHALVHDLPG